MSVKNCLRIKRGQSTQGVYMQVPADSSKMKTSGFIIL